VSHFKKRHASICYRIRKFLLISYIRPIAALHDAAYNRFPLAAVFSLEARCDKQDACRRPNRPTWLNPDHFRQGSIMTQTREQQIAALEKEWAENSRWKGIKRGYSAADVVRLRGSLQPEYTFAKRGAEKLWEKVNGGAKKGYVNAFGAITAGQAMQQAKAGLEAVYLSGWQVAAD